MELQLHNVTSRTTLSILYITCFLKNYKDQNRCVTLGAAPVKMLIFVLYFSCFYHTQWFAGQVAFLINFRPPELFHFYIAKTDYLPKTILCGFQQFGCNLTQTFTVICLQISSENKHKQIIISINWYSKHKSFVSNAYWCYNYLVIFHHYWILSISFALLQISFLFYLVTYSHPYFNL